MKSPYKLNNEINIYLICTTLILISIIIFKNNKNNDFLSSQISQDNFTITGIAQIIDGDSIKIKQHEIRLINIDAPEYKQKCTNKNNEKYNCGIESLNYLKKLTKNKILNCKISGKGYYNRILATCFTGKLNINQEIVRQGWAINYNKDSPYQKAGQTAKNQKKGIWQGKFQKPQYWRRKNKTSKK